jgi:hypothetical protein
MGECTFLFKKKRILNKLADAPREQSGKGGILPHPFSSLKASMRRNLSLIWPTSSAASFAFWNAQYAGSKEIACVSLATHLIVGRKRPTFPVVIL